MRIVRADVMHLMKINKARSRLRIPASIAELQFIYLQKDGQPESKSF